MHAHVFLGLKVLGSRFSLALYVLWFKRFNERHLPLLQCYSSLICTIMTNGDVYFLYLDVVCASDKRDRGVTMMIHCGFHC
jgi:hypothetical protein